MKKMRPHPAEICAPALLLMCLSGCVTVVVEPPPAPPPVVITAPPAAVTSAPAQPQPATGQQAATVVEVIDGDTIDVLIDGEVQRVRYIGVNTPERDETCYTSATQANAGLVEGQQVTLIKDISETDRFGRLLRYVYVGEIFVNAELVAEGWAEARRYDPDTANADYFEGLEDQARAAGLGCHPTGVFE